MEKEIINAMIDYDSGVSRLSGNKKLYEKFLLKFIVDETFDKILKAMNDDEYYEAFKSAHTLKGLAGNLSLQSLYEALIPFVEMLREDKDIQGAKNSCFNLERVYLKTIEAIKAMNIDNNG